MNAVTFCLKGLRRIWPTSAVFILFCTTMFLTSCSTPQPQETYTPPPPPPPPVVEKRMVTIVSSPQEATISVENITLGTTPVTHEFNFSQQSGYVVKGTKKDYLPVEKTIDLPTVDGAGGTIKIHLTQHPFLGITALNYPTNQWFQIVLTPEVLEQGFWKKLLNIVNKDNRKINKIYMDAGIVETAFVTENVLVGDYKEYIRSRLKTRYQQKVPEVKMNVYLETEVSSNGQEWNKYDRVRKSDVRLVDSLKKHLGVFYYLDPSLKTAGTTKEPE